MKLLITAVFVLSISVVQAQGVSTESAIDRYALVGFSVGPSLQGEGGGIATLALGLSDNVFMIRGAVTDIFEDRPFSDERATLVREVGLLYGRSLIRKESFGLIAAGGLALTRLDLDVTDGRGSLDFESRTTVGIPLQIEAIVFPLARYGLGLGAGARVSGNLNSTQSVGTAQIGLYIGGFK